MVPFRVLSRTNLAGLSPLTPFTSSISFSSFRLRTLDLSLRSFSRPDPLFSITSALFLQNTRGGGISTSLPFGISNIQPLSCPERVVRRVLRPVATLATGHPAKDANPERPSGVEGSHSALSRPSSLVTRHFSVPPARRNLPLSGFLLNPGPA